MITMSNVPKTQIETLLNLETVKENSKEDEKEKEPELAPFFLPTVAASDDVRRSVFDPSRESLVNADGDSKKSQTEPKSRILHHCRWKCRRCLAASVIVSTRRRS